MQSTNVGTYLGIPVKIHWTFGLTFLYVIYVSTTEGLSSFEGLAFGLYILTLFFCVILHEYGHALMARRFGVKTIDIIISPIGGVARLERLPRKPLQEFLVAIAGPLVNIAIASFLFFFSVIYWGLDTMLSHPTDLSNLSNPIVFLNSTILLNFILFVFNLIPAFPMDGGRILRALLSIKFSRGRATSIASKVGQVLAVGFIGVSFYFGLFTWGLIGLFVFYTARNENKNVQFEESLYGKVASDIMRTDFTKLFIGDSLKEVYDTYKNTGEHSFLVYDSLGNLAGILPFLYLKKDIDNDDLDKKVMTRVSQNFIFTEDNIDLIGLFHKMNSGGVSLAIIKNGDQQLQGVIDRHALQAFIDKSV